MNPLPKYYLYTLLSVTTPAWALNDQVTSGTCRPAGLGAQGIVTIHCQGLSDSATKTLNDLLNQVREVEDFINHVFWNRRRLGEIEGDLAEATRKLAEATGKEDTIRNLNRMIARLNQEKAQLQWEIHGLQSGIETAKLKVAKEWAKRFPELQKQLVRLEEQINALNGKAHIIEAKKELSRLAKQAQQMLDAGNLEGAGRLYDELIEKVKTQR